MAKLRAAPAGPDIRIDGVQISSPGGWQFFVTLVLPSRDTRVLAIRSEYEGAILVAERAAREHQGQRAEPLPVLDLVVRPA